MGAWPLAKAGMAVTLHDLQRTTRTDLANREVTLNQTAAARLSRKAWDLTVDCFNNRGGRQIVV
jgi:hypothetical protein